jgi:hypothetical protein
MPYNHTLRQYGKDWPANGLTMVGLVRLENVQQLLEAAMREHVPGKRRVIRVGGMMEPVS